MNNQLSFEQGVLKTVESYEAETLLLLEPEQRLETLKTLYSNRLILLGYEPSRAAYWVYQHITTA